MLNDILEPNVNVAPPVFAIVKFVLTNAPELHIQEPFEEVFKSIIPCPIYIVDRQWDYGIYFKGNRIDL